jgi:dTDP-4-amino-4,6-dideoxygalactose transaminase
MYVPLLDLKSQHQEIEAELIEAFERVLHSGHFILGREVELFEQSVAQIVDARHAIGVSSGTDAILLALMSLGIGAGDEVICPSYTFFATAGCIARVGAKPVFADCCPVCFNLSADDAARRITSRTKAIIPVHLFGQAADMDSIVALAKTHDLAVIEDAAQALGAAYRGREVGSIGTFGTFSFFPSKNLGGLGDAGMLVTNNDELAERARMLRTHGAKEKYYHQHIGGNFRLDALQAALLRVKLPHLESYSNQRRAHAMFYTENLRGLPGVSTANMAQTVCRQNNSPGCLPAEAVSSCPSGGAASSISDGETRLVLPVAYEQNRHIWNQFTLRVPGPGRRDALRQFLSARGIGSEIYYPVPLHRQECFAFLGCRDHGLPVSERVTQECLSIPVFPGLTASQLEIVVGAIADFIEEQEG